MVQASTKIVMPVLFAQGRCKKAAGVRPTLSPHLHSQAMLCVLILAGMGLAQNALAQSSWPLYRFNAALNGRAAVNGPLLPELQWTVPIGSEKIESPVVGPEGSIIFISRGDEFVYALNADGSKKWQFSRARQGGNGNETFSSPPVIGKDGNIYVGTQQGSFLSLDLNGNLRWRAAVGGFVSAAANVDNDGHLYVPVDDGRLYVFNSSGSLLCTANFDGEKPGATPALSASGRVYAPAGNNIYVFDPSCNRIAKWSLARLGEVAWVVISPNGNLVYAGSRTNALVVALNAETGNEVWAHAYDQTYGPPSPPALGPDGTIYFAGFDRGLLLALTPEGRPKAGWPLDLGTSRYKTMPVVDAQGNIFIVNERSDFGLFALAPDKRILWRLPEVQCKYSPAFGSNGTMYVPSLRKIYAVRQKPARLVASPNPVLFGQVCLNTEAVLKDTLSNDGSAELIISAFELNSPVFKFEGRAARLQPGERLIISVSFAPNLVGVFQDTLFVSSNDPDHNPFAIILRGEGISPQIAGPASLIFPATEVGMSRLDRVAIRAVGSCVLRVDSVRITGAHAADFSVVPSNFPVELGAGDSLLLPVTFNPKAVGERNATLQVFSNDTDTNPLAVALRGTGTTPQPRWEVTPRALTLAACVDTTVRDYVQIRNLGLVNIVINSATISNPAFAIDTTGLVFPFTLLPNQALFVPIRFTPADTSTSRGTLALQSNAGAETVALTGKGERPQIALAARPPRLEVCLGRSGETRIVIFNTSTSCELRVDSFRVAIAFLQQTTSTSSSFVSHPASVPLIIAPGDSATIPIEITQPPRDFELRVTFWSNAPGSPHQIVVPGKVLSPQVAAVDTVEFGVVPLQQSRGASALIWNAAQCDLDIRAARLTGADSSSFSVDVSGLPSTLRSGDTLNLPVTFSPLRAGEHFATLLVENNAPDSNPVRIVLHGAGQQVNVFPRPPQLAFLSVCLGGDSTQVVEIVNNGSVAVVAASLGFTVGRPEFSVEPTTDFQVLPGQSQALTIGFKPQTLERVTDTLRIVWQNPDVPPVLIPVSGEAVSGQIAGPEEHLFPPTPVNQTEIDTVFVRNVGVCDLVVDSAIVVKDLAANKDLPKILAQEPFAVVGDFTGRIIPPGDSLGIPVSFTPPAVGLFVANLLVYNNDPGPASDNPFTVRLIGNGLPVPPKVPDIAVERDTLSFGADCAKTTRELIFSNEGDATLFVTAFTFTDPAYTTTQAVPDTLMPGEKITLTVSFDPAVAQSAHATLSIVSNDPDENPYVIVLSGNKGQANIAGANLLLFPSTSVGSFAERIYTLHNTGACSLRVHSFSLAGQHPNDFTLTATPAVPFSLASGDTARLTIKFAPADSLARLAILNIASNDGDENPKAVQLQGNGSAPILGVGPNPLNFGKVRVGQDSCMFVLIENRSRDSLSVASAALRRSTAFKVEGQGLDLLILPGGKASISVCFAPPEPGLFGDTLDVPIAKIRNGNAREDSTFGVAVRGDGVAAAIFAQSPLNLEGERVGRSIRVTAYDAIKNVGTAPLTILSVQQPQSDFTIELLPRLPLRMEPGETKDVQITFRPSRDGELRSSFVLVSDAFRDTLHVVQLMGRGIVELVADLRVYPENLDFGRLYIRRDSTTREFHIINSGPLDLRNVEAALDHTSEYEIISPAFPLPELKSLDSVLVQVKFKPEVSGPHLNEVLVKSRQTRDPRTVQLSGIGRGRPDRGVRVRPEVFTPNSDGYNDFADFEFPDIEEVFEPVIKIFNMRGQLIATLEGNAETKTIRWNGQDQERRLVSPHTYMWILQDGDKALGSGHVGVVR